MEANPDTADIDVGAVYQFGHMSFRKSFLVVLLPKFAHAIFDQGPGIQIDDGRRRGRRTVGRQDGVRILL